MWPRVAAVAVGIWLMFAPGVLRLSDAETNDRLVGPLVVAFAVVAASEVTRSVRWVQLVLGAWLVIAPFLLGYADAAAVVDDIAAGVVVAALGFPRGETQGRFGGGWSALWRRDDETATR